MPKKIIQDIKIKKKKKIKPHYNSEVEINEIIIKKNLIHRKLSSSPISLKASKRPYGVLNILLFITLLGGMIFWGSVLFENVNIIITKKHKLFSLDKHILKATKGLEAQISFEIMIISDKKFEKIALSKSKEVSLKAKGEITFYNKNSKDVEILPINTYISDEDGKVYLTDKAISVPGFTLVKNEIIPGEKTVGVTSFLPGEIYNGSPASFSINAFKGTKKYEKIYAEAKSDMEGGVQGLRYSVDSKDYTRLGLIIDSSLKKELLEKVNSLIPENYIFYPDASNFSFKIEENVLSKTSSANVLVSGILSVVLIEEDELRDALLRDLMPGILTEESDTISTLGLNKLLFSFNNKEQSINKDLNLINFTLTGEVDFVWNPDILKLKEKLLGTVKENLSSIFKENVGIGNASVKIFPPWQSVLPTKASKIKIKVL